MRRPKNNTMPTLFTHITLSTMLTETTDSSVITEETTTAIPTNGTRKHLKFFKIITGTLFNLHQL